ncbi:unnamed protein product [Ilex paraguariensis]|uniref:Uncharacterized protein n=1 Tax=Ilex paraguariensis TaxID=185542 RepID=A0ABC8RPE0_9AQUA
MDSRNLIEKEGTQKISISDQINSLQYTSTKSDSFVVDMERFSHLTNKAIAPNSRITLQRSLSRKISQQGDERKINSGAGNEKDTSVVASSSTKAALVAVGMPEKPMVVTVGATDHPINPQVHHQITIMTGNISTPTAESKSGGRRFSFRRSSPSWAIDPRRILLYFATFSSMGTILLIYFTLSMGKLSGDDNALNW